jgi:hypothetical protein
MESVRSFILRRTSTGLHGVTSQKIALFLLTTVINPNPLLLITNSPTHQHLLLFLSCFPYFCQWLKLRHSNYLRVLLPDLRKTGFILTSRLVTRFFPCNCGKPSLKRTNRWNRVSVIADVHHNRVRGYSRKYTIGYTANTRNKQKHTIWLYTCIYIGVIFCFK